MLRRHNRLLVALLCRRRLHRGDRRLCRRLSRPFRNRLVRDHRGTAAVSALPAAARRSSRCWCVIVFQLQGLYRLRRSRTRVDDFFGVLVGTLLATLAGVAGTLYVNTYHLSDALKAEGYLEISRGGLGAVPVSDRALHATSRARRSATCCGARWRAWHRSARVLDRRRRRPRPHGRGSHHRAQRTRFQARRLRRRSRGDVGRDRLPRPALLGTTQQIAEVCAQEKVDEIYVALPLEEHVQACSRSSSSPAASASTSTSFPICCSSSRCGRGSRISTACRSSRQRRAAARLQQRRSSASCDIALSSTRAARSARFRR